MNILPIYATRELIAERLPIVFPEGTSQRNYLVRELAASTIFAMLYIGAVEGEGVYMGPVHVYRMTEEQAATPDDPSRIAYRKAALRGQPPGERWYADNTREPIRDETLREGLIRMGAVLSRTGIPTTSSEPRYYLQKNFSALFNPHLTGASLTKAIENWQKTFLSKGAITRITLAALSGKNSQGKVLVQFPNGETRHLAAGPSSTLSKAVIEVFAHSFLKDPALLWLSTSDRKTWFRDETLAAQIGLNIQPDKNLPDIIMVDLGHSDPLLIFIEVVVTDGAITDRRKAEFYKLTDAAGFGRSHVLFVTAYADRESPGARKTITSLTWKSFAWFMSEPENIVHFSEGLVSLLPPVT